MRQEGAEDDMDLEGLAFGDGSQPCWGEADTTTAAEDIDTPELRDGPAQK